MLATKCALIAVLALWHSTIAYAQIDEDLADEDLSGLDEEVDAEEPTVAIAAHKSIDFGDVSLLIVDTPFTVTYELFNLGNAPAYGVELSDSWDAGSFDVVKGEATAMFAKIDAQTSVKHTMELKAKSKGVFTCTRANITYTLQPEEEMGDDEEPEYREALTSTHGIVQVVSGAEFKRMSGDVTIEWVVAGVLAALVLIAPMFAANTAARNLRKLA